MQTITTCLWFDDQAEAAAKYYVSLFDGAKMLKTVHYPKAAEAVSGKPAGSVMTVEFEIGGQRFMALNGGKVPGFEFSSATSFIINCANQAEIDKYWVGLSAVPEAEQCGWCKDKFGVTWQVAPTILDELLGGPDQAKVERVMACFLPMKKVDIAELQKAAAQA